MSAGRVVGGLSLRDLAAHHRVPWRSNLHGQLQESPTRKRGALEVDW